MERPGNCSPHHKVTKSTKKISKHLFLVRVLCGFVVYREFLVRPITGGEPDPYCGASRRGPSVRPAPTPRREPRRCPSSEPSAPGRRKARGGAPSTPCPACPAPSPTT